MLFHLSFAARDMQKVSGFLAEVLDAKVVKAPSPPFNSEALFICCGDERGTMISLEPWGVTYEPGPANYAAMPRGAASPAHTPFHGLFFTALSEQRVLDLAAVHGWPAGRVNNGPFEVINVWLEGTQLIEFTNAELLPAYKATFDRAGLETLDASLRGLEQHLRSLGISAAS